MTTTIIDGRGRVRHGSASADIAVEDKGCVALRRRGDRAVEIRYRPSTVKPRALLRTVQLLGGSGDREHHILQAWDTDWQTALVGNRAAAIEHLMGLTTDAQSTRKRDFLSQRHASSAAAKDAAFGRLHEAWRTARGVKDQGLMEAVREVSCGRYLEVVPQNGASRLDPGRCRRGL